MSTSWKLLFGFALTLAILVSVQNAYGQRVLQNKSDQNWEIYVSTTPEGEMCSALVVNCKDTFGSPGAFGSPGRSYPDLVERLVPLSERGKFNPKTSGGDIGNCTNWQKDDYENVSILTNANTCSTRYSFTIEWKGRSCASDRTPPDVCGQKVKTWKRREDEIVRLLNGKADAIERESSRQTNDKLKQSLSALSRSLRSTASILQEQIQP